MQHSICKMASLTDISCLSAGVSLVLFRFPPCIGVKDHCSAFNISYNVVIKSTTMMKYILEALMHNNGERVLFHSDWETASQIRKLPYLVC